MTQPPNLPRLRDFVLNLAGLLDATDEEARVLEAGGALLKDLVSHDDWLPEEYAVPDPARYRQYLLHCDSLQRFSVVSFVWGPGQATPVHDHTVWGLVGVLRGAELSQAYEVAPGRLTPIGKAHRLSPGEVEAVSPTVGDVHQVANAHDDRTSVSIHVYGANIGAVSRHTFGPKGEPKTFISGYSNTHVPNLWDASQKTAS
ncbi:cysteine dioxygenase [Phenylobacterium aquaticum]|uniref:cysteine dioxygenase family protein n=1 Tax=Phenylobacterium aquaticum TaxID=1763816 RepID=UPI0026EBD3FD|nr:cysteine dioxygenase [Phenylobacterium aquaticum]